jgi:hypothetical protein
VLTKFDYGPAWGPNPSFLRGTTVSYNGNIHRTCFDYDTRGNKIAEHSPNAGLSECYPPPAGEMPPSFSISDGTVVEGGSVTLTVTKTGTVTGTYNIGWRAYATGSSFAAGSADEGYDFAAQSGMLTFGPADVTKTVTVTTKQDSYKEGSEYFQVLLSPSGNAATTNGSTGTGKIIITDND